MQFLQGQSSPTFSVICSSWCLGLLCIVSAFLWDLKPDYWSLRASLCIHLQVQIHKFVTNTKVVALMAEWLRRWTRNPMGSARAGSNPAQCECQPFFFPFFPTYYFFPCTYIYKKTRFFSEIILTFYIFKNTFFLQLTWTIDPNCTTYRCLPDDTLLKKHNNTRHK